LVEGQTYYIAVTAYDTSNNESGYSAEVAYTVPMFDLTAPSTPTSLQATAISISQINLSWNASTDNTGVTGYGIYRGSTQIATTSNTTYQDTGLSSSTTYTYTVSAYDAAGNESGQVSASSATTLSLPVPVNNPPVLSPVGNKSVNEGHALSFTISATDPDGDTLSYTTNNLPSGASFNENTRTFAWTPTYNQTGTYSNITFQVSDGKGIDSESITITVGNINRPPVLDTIANITVSEGATITLNPTATDPDGDTLTYMYTGWMTSSNYTTNDNDSGTHTVTVTVSDGILTDSQVVTVTVSNTNLPQNGIIDNGDSGTSYTGGWVVSGGSNPYGSNSLYSNESGATYTFQASEVNNTYEVSLWWTYYNNRCDSVPVDIYDGNTLIDTVYVDHLTNGGQWNVLGTYDFSGTARVVINSQGGCTTSADAVKIDVDTILPSTPTNLQATTISTSQINLSWNASTDNVGVTGYRIYRGSTLIATTSNTTYQDKGLSLSTTYTYTVSAYDAAGNESGQSSASSATTLSLPVPVNNSPLLSPVGNKSVNEGHALSFTISATDLDGDILSYTTNNLPSGASFNENTRTFAWTPTYNQTGTYSNITFQVSDGKDIDSESITITVGNINRPPVLGPITDITVSEGATITLNPAATDPNGDALTYTYSGWMGSASYTTTYDDAGTHTVTVTVSDSSLSDSQVVTVIVNDTTPIFEKTITAGDIDGNGQEDIIIDYGTGSGIWTLMNDSTWMQLHTLSSETVTTGDMDGSGQDDVIIDFGPGYGIWALMNLSTWVKIHDVSPEIIVTGDMDGNGQDEVILDGGDLYGIWIVMNNSTWVKLIDVSPEIIETGDTDGNGQDEVIIDFGDLNGVWIIMNNSTWVKLHDVSPEIIETGDMDGNGLDEVIVNFGGSYGVQILMNNSTLVKLHDISPEIITTSDMDGNGLDEVIIDGGDLYGVWIFMNNSTWAKLHDISPEIITTGDTDGNGLDEAVIDFGGSYGIHILMNNSTWYSVN
ncbi:MAG: hypothetical protein GY774_29915, partial [Planctomycetes bacterium]|nr:hypothetical protein [Planctomycetota bacterium]